MQFWSSISEQTPLNDSQMDVASDGNLSDYYRWPLPTDRGYINVTFPVVRVHKMTWAVRAWSRRLYTRMLFSMHGWHADGAVSTWHRLAYVSWRRHLSEQVTQCTTRLIWLKVSTAWLWQKLSTGGLHVRLYTVLGVYVNNKSGFCQCLSKFHSPCFW